MKKKIALLLAAVMIIAAAVPMTLFASTTFDITNTYNNLGEEIFVVNNPMLANESDVARRAVGSYIVYTFTSKAQTPGNQFNLVLENAGWAYEADWGTIERQVCDEDGEPVFLMDDDGELILDDNDKPIPVMEEVLLTAFAEGTGACYTSPEGYIYYTNVATYKTHEMRDGALTLVTKDVNSYATLLAAINAAADNYDVGVYSAASPTPFVAKYDNTWEDGNELNVQVLNAPAATAKLVIPLIFMTWSEEPVTVTGIATPGTSDVSAISQFSARTLVYVSGTGSFITSVVESRERFNLGQITITEPRAGVAQSGSLIFEAPEGYIFTSTDLTLRNGINGFPQAGVSATIPVGGEVKYPNGYVDNFVTGQFMIVNFKLGAPTESSVRRTVYLSGVKLAVSDDAYADFGKTAKIYVYDDGGSLVLSTGTSAGRGRTYFADPKSASSFDAVKRIEYGVQFDTTSDEINEIYAGDSGNSNSIVFNERALNSLLGHNDDTRFELVDEEGNSLAEQVKIVNAFISAVGGFINLSKTATGSTIKPGDTNFRIFDNYVTMVGNGIATDKRGTLTFRLGLTAAADFTGDVYLKATGRSIPRGEAEEAILIASIIAPVEVTTEVSNVEVGYQAIKVKKIVIAEDDAGLFSLNGAIEVRIQTSGYNDYVRFSNLGALTVNYVGDGILDRIVSNGTTLSIKVSRASRNVPFVITIDGIYIDVSRDVPYGKYNLVVGGSAFVYNYTDKTITPNVTKLFASAGIVVPGYINVATPGSNLALSKNVAVSLENPENAVVDGANFDISAAPAYIDAVTNRTMFSIKYIAMALGIAESEVKWDGVARTVTIYTNLRATVTMFYIDKDFYTINGGVQNMVDENGVHAFSIITNDRSYIPMKYLAEAFGLTAIWNPNTRTAYFNPTEAQKIECAQANAE